MYQTGYAIPTTEGDNRIEVKAGLKPVPWYMFEFYGNDVGGQRACDFLASYGSMCLWGIVGTDHLVFENSLIPLRAVIGSTSVEITDVLIPTGISSSS